MSLIQPDDIRHVRRQFGKAAASFAEHAAVFETVGDRLLDRLDVLAMAPQRILDLGSRNSYLLAALRQRYPQANIVACDPAPGVPPVMPSSWPSWLRRKPVASVRVASDPHHLPFADGSFDLVVSNLLLPWCHAPHAVFAEAARVLNQGGAMFFTSAGPDTLQEYRARWAAIDAHVHGFGLLDMHDLGDVLLQSGFAAPVLDRENLTVDYPSIAALEHELQSVGAANIARGRRRGLIANSVRKALHGDLQTGVSRFLVTLELVQGHAWKGELKTGRHQSSDEYRIPVDSLRRQRKK